MFGHPASARYQDRLAGRFGWAAQGGRSSSSSSSSSTTNTTDDRDTIYAERDGLAVGEGAQVTVADYGVIEGAAKVLESGFSQLTGIVENISKTSRDSVKDFKDVTLDNNKILREQQESDVKELGGVILQGLIVFGLVLVALIYLLFKKGKG